MSIKHISVLPIKGLRFMFTTDEFIINHSDVKQFIYLNNINYVCIMEVVSSRHKAYKKLPSNFIPDSNVLVCSPDELMGAAENNIDLAFGAFVESMHDTLLEDFTGAQDIQYVAFNCKHNDTWYVLDLKPNPHTGRVQIPFALFSISKVIYNITMCEDILLKDYCKKPDFTDLGAFQHIAPEDIEAKFYPKCKSEV